MKENSSSWHVVKCPRWHGISAETGGLASLTLAQRKVHNKKAGTLRFDFHTFTLDWYCSPLFTLCLDILVPVLWQIRVLTPARQKCYKSGITLSLYCKNTVLLYKNPNFSNLPKAKTFCQVFGQFAASRLCNNNMLGMPHENSQCCF